MHIDWTGASPDVLATAFAYAAPHLRHPLLAVRDHGCRFMLAAQSSERFTVPQDRPAIVIIGDDLSAALGPAGFHAESLRSYLARCSGAVIVPRVPLPEAYAHACDLAVRLRRDVVIIETRPEREAEWYGFLQAVHPTIQIALATMKPAGTA